MRFENGTSPVQKIETLSVNKEIDGLVYNIRLAQTLENSKNWRLDFIVNDSESLTNKGLGVFSKVVDVIYEFVEEVRKNQKIEKIIVKSSAEIGEDEKLQNILEERYEQNSNDFKGFNYERTEDVKFGSMNLGRITKSFKIDDNGIVFGERRHDRIKILDDKELICMKELYERSFLTLFLAEREMK